MKNVKLFKFLSMLSLSIISCNLTAYTFEKTGEVYSLIDNGKKVGFVDISILNKEGHINNIYVRDSFRKKGYGTELLKQAISNLKNKNINTIKLMTKKYESGVNGKLLKKLGFKKGKPGKTEKSEIFYTL